MYTISKQSKILITSLFSFQLKERLFELILSDGPLLCQIKEEDAGASLSLIYLIECPLSLHMHLDVGFYGICQLDVCYAHPI